MDSSIYLGRAQEERHQKVRTTSYNVREIRKSEIIRWAIAGVSFAIFLALTIRMDTDFVFAKQGVVVYAIFYALMIAVFHKSFSIKKAVKSMTYIRYWVFAAITTVVVFAVNFLKVNVSMKFFEGVSTGEVNLLLKENYGMLILYAVTMVILQPLADNMVLRRAMVSFRSQKLTVITVVISLFCGALMHAHGFVGIIESVIVSLPLMIIYVKSKNLYIPLLAQMIFCAYDIIPNTVYSIARLMLR